MSEIQKGEVADCRYKFSLGELKDVARSGRNWPDVVQVLRRMRKLSKTCRAAKRPGQKNAFSEGVEVLPGTGRGAGSRASELGDPGRAGRALRLGIHPLRTSAPPH
jgi:hypothetical protein